MSSGHPLSSRLWCWLPLLQAPTCWSLLVPAPGNAADFGEVFSEVLPSSQPQPGPLSTSLAPTGEHLLPDLLELHLHFQTVILLHVTNDWRDSTPNAKEGLA